MVEWKNKLDAVGSTAEDVIAHHTSKQYAERFDYQVNNMREE